MVFHHTQVSRWTRYGVLALAVSTGMAWHLFGQSASSPTIVSVEEEWELVIGTPSPNADAPQVTCVISPVGNADGIHSTFIVNHHDVPTFTAGGLQLQVWNSDELLQSQRAPNQAVLATPGEKITWKQRLSIDDGKLVFQVLDGTSTTWGAFGSDDSLKLSVATDLTNLSGYDPQVSVDNSGVSYSANRVTSLVLRSVRFTMSNGDVLEDPTARAVYPKEE
jgi:hypothetical protein